LRAAFAADDPPGLAARRRDEPGVEARGLFDTLDALEQRREDLLKDFRGEVFVEAGAAGDGVDEALVALDERLPGRLVAAPAVQQQLLIRSLHLVSVSAGVGAPA
jgi:hypothetical protein